MKFQSILFYGRIYRIIFQVFVTLVIIGLEAAQAQEKIPSEVNIIISRCEKAMGGREAYDRLRHITWNFFGNRSLTWDKSTGDLRVDLRTEKSIYLVNLNTKKGRIYKNGREYTQPDSLARYLKDARDMWVNDSFWLLLPWKLREPGINYVYAGEMRSLQGYQCYVVQITFDKNGMAPGNKYLIFFDKESGLICQWDFYESGHEAAPLFSTVCKNYKGYGGVLISGDRGERELSDIHVFSKLPESVYKEFKRPFYLGRHDDI